MIPAPRWCRWRIPTFRKSQLPKAIWTPKKNLCFLKTWPSTTRPPIFWPATTSTRWWWRPPRSSTLIWRWRCWSRGGTCWWRSHWRSTAPTPPGSQGQARRDRSRRACPCDPGGVGAVERQWLLHQQVPPRLQHRHRQISVEDRGGRHHHRVDVVAGQKIGGRVVDGHVFRKHKFFLGVQIAFGSWLFRKVGIRHRHQRGAGITVERLGVRPSHQAKSNDANTYFCHRRDAIELPAEVVCWT